jgi:hypothetical protein
VDLADLLNAWRAREQDDSRITILSVDNEQILAVAIHNPIAGTSAIMHMDENQGYLMYSHRMQGNQSLHHFTYEQVAGSAYVADAIVDGVFKHVMELIGTNRL